MKENLTIKGFIKVYRGKKEKLIYETENLFLNTGKQAIIDLFLGLENNLKYDYVVLGDGANAPNPNDLTLQNELFRKQITEMYRYRNSVIVDIFIENNEANFKWEEIGLVSNGNLQKNSGRLFNRANLDIDKNSGSSLTISWEVRIQ